MFRITYKGFWSVCVLVFGSTQLLFVWASAVYKVLFIYANTFNSHNPMR